MENQMGRLHDATRDKALEKYLESVLTSNIREVMGPIVFSPECGIHDARSVP
jgi:hypothetical protein